jgi:hypothetical protein
MCRECQESCQDIHSWDWTPNQYHTFTAPKESENKRRLCFGLEIETENDGGNVGSLIHLLPNEASMVAPWYLKHDGSLYEGVEAVSHPGTLDYWLGKDRFNWLRQAAKAGFRSYQTQTCGFHVHVGREALGRLATYKLLHVTSSFSRWIFKLSRRKPGRFGEWASPIDVRMCASMSHRMKTDKYSAINTSKRATVECRIFRGTLHSGALLRNLAWFALLCLWAREESIQSLHPVAFHAWIRRRGAEFVGRILAEAVVTWSEKKYSEAYD